MQLTALRRPPQRRVDRGGDRRGPRYAEHPRVARHVPTTLAGIRALAEYAVTEDVALDGLAGGVEALCASIVAAENRCWPIAFSRPTLES